MTAFRVGHGYDVHALVKDRPLILAGLRIEHPKGLMGHSDADVLIHALCDALLGAAALGDLGSHFPDNDPAYKNINSRNLLRETRKMVLQAGYRVVNIDTTLVMQQPKIQPYISEMRKNLSHDLQIDFNQISVKATTTEGLGFAGKEEGIAAHAVVLIEKL
jgi:2-C-methyl-D-erythritol 2,4-cyclodiphosphate synthase